MLPHVHGSGLGAECGVESDADVFGHGSSWPCSAACQNEDVKGHLTGAVDLRHGFG